MCRMILILALRLIFFNQSVSRMIQYDIYMKPILIVIFKIPYCIKGYELSFSYTSDMMMLA